MAIARSLMVSSYSSFFISEINFVDLLSVSLIFISTEFKTHRSLVSCVDTSTYFAEWVVKPRDWNKSTVAFIISSYVEKDFIEDKNHPRMLQIDSNNFPK